MKKILITSLSLAVFLSGIPAMSTINVHAKEQNSIVNQENIRVIKDGVRIFLIDGDMYEWPADAPDPTPQEIKALKQERGKIGAAVKAIRIGYSKIPKWIRNLIAKYAGLEAILSQLDHWTGAIEDGIYNACRSVGMPEWLAWLVAKALTGIAL